MGFSKAIGTQRDVSANAYPVFGNTAAKAESTGSAVSFDRVFRDTHFGAEIAAGTDSEPENGNITFSAGAEIERMSAMSQVKDLFFSDELDMFEDDGDLDDTIGFDEVKELDLIADDEAAKKPEEMTILTDETADFLDSVLSDDEDTLTFSDIEEM